MTTNNAGYSRARPLRALWLLLLAVTYGFSSSVVAGQSLTLNLNDTEIKALISTVSEITGKNFVIDPRVKGKVTVISSSPLEDDELYQVFLSILKIHGFAAIPSGKVIKIVPDATAKQDSIPTADDQDGGDGIVTRVLRVENVPASDLAPILRPLIPQQGHLAAHAPTNTLIISDTAANIDRILQLVRRVDRATDREIEIIRLQHASAAEVVRVLSSLRQSGRPDAKGSDAPMLVADERGNSILLGGDKSTRLELRALISHLDTPIESDERTQVIYLRYTLAKEIAPIIKGVGASLGSLPESEASGTKTSFDVQIDESTNALVITAPPALLQSLQSVIRQLDIRRAQVLVESIIAEVSDDKTAELGVQWRTNLETEDGILAGTSFPGTLAGRIDSFPGDPVGLAPGLSVGFFSGGTVRALVRALAGDSFTNVLSTPTLVTLDNEEAEIVVGQNVPFVTGSYTGETTTPDNPFQTIERQDVGILLKVKPQINEGDTVMLSISQEVSSIARDTSGADLITNKRSIQTTVLVDDGNIVALGGLIDKDLQENVQKVPLLGDLPILGALFRNKSTDYIKKNLMVFIRPSIVRDKKTSAYFTGGKYNLIRDAQLQRARRGVPLMPAESPPVLPELDEFKVPTDPDEKQTSESTQAPADLTEMLQE